MGNSQLRSYSKLVQTLVSDLIFFASQIATVQEGDPHVIPQGCGYLHELLGTNYRQFFEASKETARNNGECKFSFRRENGNDIVEMIFLKTKDGPKLLCVVFHVGKSIERACVM